MWYIAIKDTSRSSSEHFYLPISEMLIYLVFLTLRGNRRKYNKREEEKRTCPSSPPRDLDSVKEKNFLTLVKMVRKTLFRTVRMHVETIPLRQRDRAQL